MHLFADNGGIISYGQLKHKIYHLTLIHHPTEWKSPTTNGKIKISCFIGLGFPPRVAPRLPARSRFGEGRELNVNWLCGVS